MKNLKTQMRFASLLSLLLLACAAAFGQLTPSADSYTNTADPTTNYGSKTLLDVESASQTAYIQFDLSAIPAGYTGSNITKASLKLYVNTVVKAGSFNVDYVNGAWAESTIDASTAPALGTTIQASVPLTTTDKNQYILIDITPAVQAWLNGTPNDGIALVGNSPVNATFDSKETTSTSHPAELDIVFTPGSGGGITGITTASGSGLMGGGTSGTLNLSLLNTCAAKQILQWSGSAWACASPGTGTVTSVASGAGLTGGPITGSGTLSIAAAGVANTMLANPSLTVTASTGLTGGGAVALGSSTTLAVDTTKVPLLASANTFTTNQKVTGTVTATSFSGSGANLTGVIAANSTELGGLAPSAYAQLSANNTFTGAQTINNAMSVASSSATSLTATSTATGGVGVKGTGSGAGVYGTGNYGVYGNDNGAADGAGVYGFDTSGSGYGVLGEGAVGVYGADNKEGGTGVLGSDYSGSGYGVYGVGGTGIYGSGGTGVLGTDNGFSGVGVYGLDTSGSGTGVLGTGATGVTGSNASGTGVGVYGAVAGSGGTSGNGSGVWGDTGGAAGDTIAVLGTAAANEAGVFVNYGPYTTLSADSTAESNSGALMFEAYDFSTGDSCKIDVNGNLNCSGEVAGVVKVDGGARKVALYSMQSPENWFEDFGSGSLSNGAVTIKLDPTFAQTVNTGTEYHVFLTPNGDSKGLYVSQKSATSFEVHEQGGGSSNVAFDYRIVAKRSGYENVRLADLTDEVNRQDAQRRKMQNRMHPAAAMSLPKLPVAPKAPAEMKPPVLPRPTLPAHPAMKPVAAPTK
jgi:hypothetical protein